MPKDRYVGDKREKFYIAIIDLASFLKYFAKPGELYTYLFKKAQNVMADWKLKNSAKEMYGHRRPTYWSEPVAEYSWQNNHGNTERTFYDIQINNFGFTKTADKTDNPRIRLQDLKVGTAVVGTGRNKMNILFLH
jgi:hypothetical protein